MDLYPLCTNLEDSATSCLPGLYSCIVCNEFHEAQHATLLRGSPALRCDDPGSNPDPDHVRFILMNWL
jgi:hypothetical protein